MRIIDVGVEEYNKQLEIKRTQVVYPNDVIDSRVSKLMDANNIFVKINSMLKNSIYNDISKLSQNDDLDDNCKGIDTSCGYLNPSRHVKSSHESNDFKNNSFRVNNELLSKQHQFLAANYQNHSLRVNPALQSNQSMNSNRLLTCYEEYLYRQQQQQMQLAFQQNMLQNMNSSST